MRKSTKWVLLIAAAMLVVVAVVASLATGPRSSTWDSYAVIGIGMTEAEVVAVLGSPDASNTGPINFCVSMKADESAAFEKLDTLEWITDEALIWVGFSPDGRVAKKFCTANRPPSWLAAALYRLGW